MTSSYTTNKSIEKPANGDYNNTWSVPVNSDWDIIDKAFGGTTSLNAVSVSGTVTLTTSQYQAPIVIISGALTANINYQLPAGVGGYWFVFNNTTTPSGGPFSIVFSSAGGGSTVTLAQGLTTAVICNGTNVGRADTNPPAAGGSTTQVQFNSGGLLAGSSGFVFDGANVGIGTASPGMKLDVSSSTFNIVASRSTAGYAAFQRFAPTGQQVYDFYSINGVEAARITVDGSNFMGFSTGSAAAERMRISSAGFVGIGTSAPTGLLQLVAGTNDSLLFRGPITLATGGSIYAVNAANSVVTPLEFAASVYYFAGGNVGIGNSAPSTPLQVTGTVTATTFAGAGTGLTGTAAALSIGGNAANVTGTVAVANGGTGQTTYTNGQLLIGNTTGNTLTKSTLTAGTGVTITNGTGTITIAATGTGGTVTSTSVVSANGFAGTVATATTTPAITLTTTITGVLKGNGTAISAATAGTDYVAPGGALGTPSSGNLANCTFPTLNQSTSGSAATFTSTTQNSEFNSIGVGTAGSGTAGEIRATNNVTAFYSSDARLKENVQPIENALDIVSAVGGKTFDWTDAYIEVHGGEDGYFVRKNDFGVIAQDVRSVFPLAVRTRDDGILAVDYEKLVAVAFAAIAELKAEVDELRQQAVKVIK